jgi:hypothetical protein
MAENQNGKNTPLKKFQVGCVTAVIWKNPVRMQTQVVPTHTIAIERKYKDAHGQWKQTHLLKLNEIPKAVVALIKAYTWLLTEYPKMLKQAQQPVQQHMPAQLNGLDEMDPLLDMRIFG